MKKILIIILIAQSLFSCKKTEISPQEQLNNTFWTGFFNYEPQKDGYTGYELIQPFAIEFLSNGNINWSETLGNSGGKWVLTDQTITITQDNKNVITLSYIDGEIGFVKMVGPTAKWTATSIEKYNPDTDKPISNTVWSSNLTDSVNLIEVNANPKLDWGSHKNVAIKVKNNMIIANPEGFQLPEKSAFMIIRNNEMYLVSRSYKSLIQLNFTKK